jgi:hypothetical protein
MRTMTSGFPTKVWHYLLINLSTGVFFYGQTEAHRKDDRHKDREYTKLLADWNIQKQKHKTFWFEIPKRGSHLDKKVHPKIDILPIIIPNPNRGNNENFHLKDIKDLDLLIKEIEKIVFVEFKGKRERIAFVPRYPQLIFRNKINAAFLNGFKTFLLCSVMRSGKNGMLCQAIVDHKFKQSIVVCRRNSPEDGLKEDIERFDAFENLEYIRMGRMGWQQRRDAALTAGRQVVLFTTAQYLVDKLHLFSKNDINLLAFDEVHLGGDAAQVDKIRNHFDSSYVIDISGTAFDYIPFYSEENRFVWTYYDNVKYCTKNNLPFSKINSAVAKYCTVFKQYHPEAPDSISNLFDLDDDKIDFRYPALVRAFINEHLIVGKNPKILPSKYTLLNSKHIYCAMPSMMACDLMCKYILESDCIYHPMSCHSQTNKTSDQINAHHKQYSHTIDFTVSANVLGVTAQWDTVMFLNTGESLSQWLQMVFRACSNPNRNALVVDFAAERSLRLMRDYYLLTYSSSDSDSSETEVSYLDCINTLGYNTGFESLDITEIDNMLALDIKDVSKICTNIHINKEKLADFNFDNIDYQKSGHHPFEYYEANNNDTNQEKAKKISKNPSQKLTKDELKKKIESLNVFLTRFSKVILMEQMDNRRVETIESLLQSPHFRETVNLHPTVIKDMIDEEIINLNIMNSRISDVNTCVAKNLNVNLIEALKSVSSFDGVHRPIPDECLCGMMKKQSI